MSLKKENKKQQQEHEADKAKGQEQHASVVNASEDNAILADKDTSSFVKELAEVVTGFVTKQSKPKADPLVDKLFAHQQEGKLRELQLLQARIQEALPGELKKLQRRLTLLKCNRQEHQLFLLAEQDKVEAELQQSPLHASFGSWSVHAVKPEHMWQHYTSLRPGATGLVYAYQLKREMHALLETELEKLEMQPENESGNGVGVESKQESNTSPDIPSPVHAAPTQAVAKTGRQVLKTVDRAFHELFVHKQEANRILALLVEHQIIHPDHSWKGSTQLKTEIASLAQVLQMKGYFKNCAMRELGRVFNAYFRIDLDISSYRKPTNEEVEKYYRRLIVKSSS